MAYADLADEQKQTIEQFQAIFRPAIGQGARYLNVVKLALLAWTTGAQSALAGLQDSDEIPNTTSLAGAKALTKAEITALVGGFSNLVGGYGGDETIALHVKAAGINSLVQ